MIRLLLLLVAGLAATFWLAGTLPKPERHAVVSSGKPGAIAQFLAAFAPERRAAGPVTTSETDRAVTVPFMHPAVVGPDGLPIVVETPPEPTQIASAPEDRAPQPVPSVAPNLGVFVVSADRVNVRAGPSTDFDILDQLTRGEAVTKVADLDNGWAMIRIEGDGVEGYMAGRFLSAE